MNKIFKISRIVFSLTIIIFLAYYVLYYNNNAIIKFPSQSTDNIITSGGTGLKEDPFLISNEVQFASFRDSVNNGNSYINCYFLQTENLDLVNSEFWTPIGEYGTGHYFLGTYDGGGYTISNLNCSGENAANDNVGLFGQLGGTVMNLGIESGLIQGAYVGGIASHSFGNDAMIINCYSKVDIIAYGRGGGIADNFSGGYIANTWFGGKISAEVSGGICSYDANMIYWCYSPQSIYNSNFSGQCEYSNIITEQYLDNNDTVELLNNNILPCAYFFKKDKGSLVHWSLMNGSNTFASQL